MHVSYPIKLIQTNALVHSCMQASSRAILEDAAQMFLPVDACDFIMHDPIKALIIGMICPTHSTHLLAPVIEE